jgi:hypothetical protein
LEVDDGARFCACSPLPLLESLYDQRGQILPTTDRPALG